MEYTQAVYLTNKKYTLFSSAMTLDEVESSFELEGMSYIVELNDGQLRYCYTPNRHASFAFSMLCEIGAWYVHAFTQIIEYHHLDIVTVEIPYKPYVTDAKRVNIIKDSKELA